MRACDRDSRNLAVSEIRHQKIRVDKKASFYGSVNVSGLSGMRSLGSESGRHKLT